MTETAKWKMIGTLVAVVLAVYLLVPTLFNFKGMAEEASKNNKPLPWYISVFPKKGVNLGLDLRGGLYLEMDVDLKEALKNRVDVLISEVERVVNKKDYPDLKMERIGEERVRVFLSADKKKTFMAEVNDNFGDALEQIGKTSEVYYRISVAEELPTLIQKVSLHLNENDISVLDVQRGGIENVLRIVLVQPGTQAAVIKSLNASPFAASLTEINLEDIFVLKLTDEYANYLRQITLKQAVEAVRNRIDRYGVAEAGIQTQGDERVIIEIPGVKDPDRVIDIIRKTGQLEFKLIDDSVDNATLSGWIQEAREKNKIGSGFSKDVVDKINKALKGKIPEDVEVLFEIQRDSITKEVVNGIPYLVKKRADVTGDMLRSAQVGIVQNEPHVNLSFNKIGTRNFAKITRENVGKPLAIVLDGVVSKAPIIQTAITNGQAQITLGFGTYQSLLDEAEDLALLLREGALPATLTIATKTVIGPSLGLDSIQKGIKSILIAAIVLVIFMIAYYKLGGLLSVFALGLNVTFIFAILALFQASLTLPGIAGIVLTMGMAVDANVIIFERMREEKRRGKSAKSVVESSYGNAMSAIIDSNITTLIAGIVLFQFGTGPIKGFATTLMIGIVTTLFTAVVVTRLVYDYFVYKRKITRVIV